METHGNQVLVNAHLLLANLGSDAYLLNVDLDEYLVTDNRTTLPELADGCFGNQTARLVRWVRVRFTLRATVRVGTRVRVRARKGSSTSATSPTVRRTGACLAVEGCGVGQTVSMASTTRACACPPSIFTFTKRTACDAMRSGA